MGKEKKMNMERTCPEYAISQANKNKHEPETGRPRALAPKKWKNNRTSSSQEI